MVYAFKLYCIEAERNAIANQLINKLSRSIKSIHLMEVIFGILIPGEVSLMEVLKSL